MNLKINERHTVPLNVASTELDNQLMSKIGDRGFLNLWDHIGTVEVRDILWRINLILQFSFLQFLLQLLYLMVIFQLSWDHSEGNYFPKFK